MTTTLAGRPTLAAIDAAALRHNFALVRKAAPGAVAILAVVKADGYGHGARLVAPVFETAGADWFGVRPLRMLELQTHLRDLIRNGRQTTAHAGAAPQPGARLSA